ncbi:hypothetical protein KC19_10G158900 [Ceratodon purpureus]|uniref:Uncharacterized protein n=1 Tax=Ceratodon purpureus TaxID=3225 RepID=A0A8T0GKS9_CERPU|nr:hypothetical protein KC19_10G158900 [Ceratodon purpureus]
MCWTLSPCEIMALSMLPVHVSLKLAPHLTTYHRSAFFISPHLPQEFHVHSSLAYIKAMASSQHCRSMA